MLIKEIRSIKMKINDRPIEGEEELLEIMGLLVCLRENIEMLEVKYLEN